MNKYYVVLTGAMKNAGDFLITEKCKELLKYEKPDYDLVQLNRWEPMEPHLDLINKSEALILMGGPAVTENLYPDIYKLTVNLDDIKVPIVPMAVGWNSKRGTFKDMKEFMFSNESESLLNKFKNNKVGISTRDSYTADILNSIGLNNVFLTGCASWYTPSKFNQISKIKKIRSIAFTPAQDTKYSELSKSLMNVLRDEFPDIKIYCVFHRGIGIVDKYTSEEDAKNTLELSKYAENLGMENIDLSYSFDNYKEYDKIDFHVGFRVHGHLYFLSNRKPSLLIHEDGRGKAMSETIGLYGVDAFMPSKTQAVTELLNKLLNKAKIKKRFHPEVRLESIDETRHLIKTHLNNNFNLINGVYKNFDENYSVMKEFIHRLP